MIETRVNFAIAGGVTFVHVLPRSRDTWISPSSDPAHNTSAVHRRFGEREDRRVPLRARHVVRDRAARGAERLRIVQREIGADRLPAVAVVRRAEDAIRRRVQHARIVLRVDDRDTSTESDSGTSRAAQPS